MAFFKPTGRNNAVIDVDALPASMFIDANNVVDICQIKIMTRAQQKELSPGEPDIVLTSATGGRSRISRRQLIENFTFLNGKKVRLSSLHSGKIYTVKRYCNVPCKAIKLPNNVIGVHKGRKISEKGAYIVAQLTPDGSLDRSTLKVMRATDFRKLFKIPEQEVITRNRGKGHKELNVGNVSRLYRQAKEQARTRRREQLNPSPAFEANTGQGLNPFATNQTSRPTGFNPSGANPFANSPFARSTQNTRNPFAQQSKPIQQQTQQQQTPTPNRTRVYPYIATQAIYSRTGEKLLGYTIRIKSNGREKDFTIDQVKEMCAKRKVENIMLVSNNVNDTSLASKFLRGNGISLDKLPRKLV